MCGIVGYKPLQEVDHAICRDAFERLFEQSCIRGMHAYGIADSDNLYVTVHKFFNAIDVTGNFRPDLPTIAHARYCQSGDWRVLENNQPIVVNNTALAMNGVISMGTKEEYEAEFGVTCSVDNDSEIFLRKINPENVLRSAEDFVSSINGSFAGTFLAGGKLFAGRNSRRPLWKCLAYGAKWYASTEDIFRRAGFVGMEPVAVGFEEA